MVLSLGGSRALADFIKRHNVFTVDLTATDVDAVVHTLIYDGLVEEFEEDGACTSTLL